MKYLNSFGNVFGQIGPILGPYIGTLKCAKTQYCIMRVLYLTVLIPHPKLQGYFVQSRTSAPQKNICFALIAQTPQRF